MNDKPFDLDKPLFKLSGHPESPSFTIRDSVEGVQIFGGIGSGKTSGSGRLLAIRYLMSGFGGLVLTAKPDELKLWRGYCQEANRSADLLVVEPGKNNYFNFLEYESSGKKEVSYTDNIFQVLKTVIKASEEKTLGKSDDMFWENSLNMFITQIISLCLLSYKKVTVPLLYDIAQAAPRKKENSNQKSDTDGKDNAYKKAARAARDNIKKQITLWERSLQPGVLKAMSDEIYEERLSDEVADYRTIKIINQFFTESFFGIGEKTRSIIDLSFTGFLFRLLRDPVYSLFCQHKSTFTPDDSLNGKIIILNLPVKTYDKIGQDSQILFKYIWQRAMERRNTEKNKRPVFLWSDESQNFLHEHDAVYQATARSSLIATVYISQNLPNYYANMGGDKFEFKVKSFLGTLATKIFHANADVETNFYASELIGEHYVSDESHSMDMQGEFNLSKSWSEQLRKRVRPDEFQGMKCGGPLNQFKVEAYIHMQSKHLKSGMSHQKICFNQIKKL